MFKIANYASPKSDVSLFKGIPIQYLQEAKEALKACGYKYRIKYRGPRSGLDCRTRDQRQASCLRKFATTFAVYPAATDWSVWKK